MKKNSIIYLAVIGLIGLLSSCEKDGTTVTMSASPIVPTIVTLPNLTLLRTNSADTLIFVGTPVDAGFQASVNYFLEACPSGDNFTHVTSIMSSFKDIEFKITVGDLNSILLKSFDADKVSSADFRIRSVLVADAGTNVAPLAYSSPLKTAEVTPYGLPRLDLIGSGIDQKIESTLGNGKYFGYVKLDVANPFTLKDPDLGIVYGGSAGVLSVSGANITPDASGWHKLNADTKALTYKLDAYMIGLVGSATPNAWDAPDQKMDYDAKTGTWKITIDLVAGDIKFRLNDGWNWNLGGTADKLTVDGSNITLASGNYTIVLTITNPNSVKGEVGGYCKITKNN